MSRLIEGQELNNLEPIIEAARLEGLRATCQKDQRGVVIFKGQDLLGKAFNGPMSPYQCLSENCFEVCGLFALHAERKAIMDALSKGNDLNGASVLHVRVEESQIQISGNLRCEDCTAYMMRFIRKGILLEEFILLQENGWTAYSIPEALEVTRRNLNL